MYNDKSHTVMKSLASIFHPVHVILLNFSECAQKRLITFGKTIFSYLPTYFFSNSSGSNLENEVIGLSRKDRLEAIYDCLAVVLQPLFGDRTHVLAGCRATTMNKPNTKVHPTICSSVVYLHEAEGMIGVLNGNQRRRKCHHGLYSTRKINK